MGVTGIENMGRIATVLLRGSNKMLLDEADRSFHDSLCATRCLVKKQFLICGGGAPEIELAIQLAEYAKAFEIVPYTLAENAGLNAMNIVTELRNRHVNGEKFDGINVRRGAITNMSEESVLQPLLVDTSAVKLATECVRAILKIGDIVPTR